MVRTKTNVSDEGDLLATRAVAVGVGLLALMITWLVANRITGVVWEPPAGPVVAMALAVVSGLVTGAIGFRRLMARRD